MGVLRYAQLADVGAADFAVPETVITVLPGGPGSSPHSDGSKEVRDV